MPSHPCSWEIVRNLVKDSDNHQYIETIEGSGPAINLISVLPYQQGFQAAFIEGLAPLGPRYHRIWQGYGVCNVVYYVLMNFIDFKSLAKAIVAERFSPNKKAQRDMLGSCFAHGLSHEEAESEILVQLYVKSYYS